MVKNKSSLLGPIVISLKSRHLTTTEKTILLNQNIGGIILFARNFQNKQQIIDLVADIRAINKYIIIMIDHEGGRVWRFKNQEFTNPGPMKKLGELFDYDPTAALNQIYEHGKVIAKELSDCDIDLNLAPVLDLDHDGLSSVIGDRALHADPNIVALMALKFIQGQQHYGMQAIGKHFPGHGAIKADTHLSIAIDHRLKENIFSTDLIPFKKLISGDPKLNIPPNSLPGLMPAHVIYPAIDPICPAGFSEIWLKDILRKELNFKGVIISDCLSMKAAQEFQVDQLLKITNISGSSKQIKNLTLTKQALMAGCDLVIFNGLHDQDLEHLLNHIDQIDPLLSSEKLERSARITSLSIIK